MTDTSEPVLASGEATGSPTDDDLVFHLSQHQFDVVESQFRARFKSLKKGEFPTEPLSVDYKEGEGQSRFIQSYPGAPAVVSVLM